MTLSFAIRRPRDFEGPACRMLLPECRPEEGEREYLVAVQDTPPQIVAAASFRRGVNAYFSVRIRVMRMYRRRKIGSGLLREVIQEAVRGGVGQVLVRVDPNSEPEAGGFLQAHGFARQLRLTTVEAEAESMHRQLAAFRERLLSSGKVPPGIRIVSLPDAPRDQIARLYAEHIAHDPELEPVVMRYSKSRTRLSESPVLMIGERVAAMLLWSREGTTAVVHARVVTPAYRGGWANALLLAEGLERACSGGSRRVRFEVPGGNRDTLKLARRFEAAAIATFDQFVLDLPPPDGSRQAAERVP